ncbi:box C/D snoRNA protein 1 isoform X3 [Rhizophagus clarus]|nr:box C/D snoRNA protein 1 isoform X3 [Rhizophagus clarus]
MVDYYNFTDPLALILQGYEDSDEEKVESKGQVKSKVEEPNTSKDQIFSEISSAALSDSLRETTSKNLLENHPDSTKCQNCNVIAWKYKCPKCNFHSCSLKCCKLHKEKYSCEGIRSKVNYVPIEQYGYENLMSDYVFLEDISRTIDSAHRFMSDNKQMFEERRRKYFPYSKKRKFNKFKKRHN